jgi:hypothetical protein
LGTKAQYPSMARTNLPEGLFLNRAVFILNASLVSFLLIKQNACFV